MKRLLGFAFVVIALTLPAQVPADGLQAGTWKLTTMAPSGNAETTEWLFNLDVKGNKATATLVAANPALKKAALVSFTAKDNMVRLVTKSKAGTKTFEGRLSKDGNKIVGVFGTDKATQAAFMVPTTMTTIESKDVTRKLAIAQLDKLQSLKDAAAAMELKAKDTAEPEERTKLLKQAAEASQKAVAQEAELYLDLIAKQPKTFAAERAAIALLQRVSFTAKDAELKVLAEVSSQQAASFGPNWQAEVNLEIAAAFFKRNKSNLAMEYVERAEKLLVGSTSLEFQIRVLRQLAVVWGNAGRAAERKAVAERMEKLLDQQYMAEVPPFKGEKFAGRKAKNDRVVVMELFTGAQCPPCVAADVAFDVLGKTYKTSDLVLIQYHLHIPGPDPMTNNDTEGRAKYYGARSTPSTFFNGTSKGGGGGNMSAAEKKYEAYRRIINPLLEQPATLKIAAQARRDGNKVFIETNVTGVKEPGSDMKLRLVLVEETVRFVGSNKLRFHHQVVRSMPGGVNGVSLLKPDMTTRNQVDITDLTKQLHKYLDNFAAIKRAFPQPGRPMDMTNLRVIAMVQDDSTSEILQAVQVNVE